MLHLWSVLGAFISSKWSYRIGACGTCEEKHHLTVQIKCPVVEKHYYRTDTCWYFKLGDGGAVFTFWGCWGVNLFDLSFHSLWIFQDLCFFELFNVMRWIDFYPIGSSMIKYSTFSVVTTLMDNFVYLKILLLSLVKYTPPFNPGYNVSWVIFLRE